MDTRLALIAELFALAGFSLQALRIADIQIHIIDRHDAGRFGRGHHLAAGVQDNPVD